MRIRPGIRATGGRPHDPSDDGEINLTAYLDIVTNIILFLLVTVTTVVSATNIAVSSPRSVPPPLDRASSGLNLMITVTRSGFIVAHVGGVLGDGCSAEGRSPSVPLRGGDWDFAALERCVRKVKARFPAETRATIAANPDIRYETVVGAIDAIRGTSAAPLFPAIQMSTGIR